MAESERVISVAELVRRLRHATEHATSGEWIEGEVGALKQAPSGHVYFSLKDERSEALIDCVMYKFHAMRARRVLSDGARLQLRGRATVYAPRGRLQWLAEAARPAGRGALLEALERLKKRLTEEGLFAEERKRPLPDEPRVIGVVTSRSGAAVRDICAVARRRGAVRIVISHAVVQGESAPESIIRALDRLEGYPGLDVIIVGRGGGSEDDLMCFNDERVVRRVAALQLPVVSAVGHEVDTTLVDLAADRRAATPSQAAELVVPDDATRRHLLESRQRHLGRAMLSVLHRRGAAIDRSRSRLTDPRFLIAERQQHLDELRLRSERALRRVVGAKVATTERLHRRLLGQHPRALLAARRLQLEPLATRLDAAVWRRLETSRARLSELSTAMNALSPLASLGRGYALVTGPDGRAVRDAAQLRPGSRISVRVQRGTFAAEVVELTSTVENAPGFDEESPARVTGDAS